MPTDPVLTRHLLTVLSRVVDIGLEEQTAMAELECQAGRPLTTQAARDCLRFGVDRGWVGSRRDPDFGTTRYWITPAGRNRLQHF